MQDLTTVFLMNGSCYHWSIKKSGSVIRACDPVITAHITHANAARCIVGIAEFTCAFDSGPYLQAAVGQQAVKVSQTRSYR